MQITKQKVKSVNRLIKVKAKVGNIEFQTLERGYTRQITFWTMAAILRGLFEQTKEQKGYATPPGEVKHWTLGYNKMWILSQL